MNNSQRRRNKKLGKRKKPNAQRARIIVDGDRYTQQFNGNTRVYSKCKRTGQVVRVV